MRISAVLLYLTILSIHVFGYGESKVIEGKSPLPLPQKQHVGYVPLMDAYGSQIFFWLVESSENSAADPLILWLSGGPGCAGTFAMFYENGPYSIDAKIQLHSNPYSWTKFATILWVDQPFETGYSHSTRDTVKNEHDVAKEMKSFLLIFFQQYPQYAKLPFFVFGESYGGRYAPTVANVVLELNKEFKEFIEASEDKGSLVTIPQPISLHGVYIGNGVVDPLYQAPSQLPFAHLYGLLNLTMINKIAHTTSKCEGVLQSGDWTQAAKICGKIVIDILESAGNINPMRVNEHCSISECFDYSNYITYFNKASVKSQLGVPKEKKWEACNRKVLFTDEDRWKSFLPVVEKLLNDNIRIMAVYGDYDLVEPFIGGLNWTLHLSWNQQDLYKTADMLPVYLETDSVEKENTDAQNKKSLVAYIKGGGNMAFVRVLEGSHMVPHSSPAAAAAIVKSFVSNKFAK